MGKRRTPLILIGDFETTVFPQQEKTEVWASAVVELFKEDVQVFHSIGETFSYLSSLNSDVIIYYHNLKFDGTFWLYYLIHEMHFEQAYSKTEDNILVWKKEEEMPNNSVKYIISDMGQWYTIVVRVNGYTIFIKDSLKLLPTSVKRLGESFKTKHQKLDIEYEGFRYAGCDISDEEMEYIKNDVLVVKEALEIMFKEGHTSLTIGSCCLKEYKEVFRKEHYKNDWERFFPDLTQVKLDKDKYGCDNADQYIRKSYKGGWCYLVEGKEDTIFTNGTTADVNSLYPSVMHSESGNRYPVGRPRFWKGDFIPQYCNQDDIWYVVRFECRFILKENMLPTVQIKGSHLYRSTEWLKRSDFYSYKTGKYYKTMQDQNGIVYDSKPIMTMTKTDYEMFREHYYVSELKIYDGCAFNTEIGIFDTYINKYREIKMNSKGALREIAKLFLNNLYGKLATNENSSFKIVDNETVEKLKFNTIKAEDKDVVYIPCGTAITSYARKFTITAAQKNFHGVNERGFIYADTDSIHCDLSPDEIVGVPVHNTAFCHWKLESNWDRAIFIRQKTYIEHIVAENLEPIDEPYNNIKCAGMPAECKWQLDASLEHKTEQDMIKKFGQKKWRDLPEREKEFALTPREMTDFKRGLQIYGKLLPVQMTGGTVLCSTTYELR